jgi:hypothetical protein
MKRNFTQKWCLLALLVCISGAAAHAQARSYYVRANGDDNNNGRSEDAPFKTLEKAVEMAKAGVIKTITVIGPIEGGRTSIHDTGSDEILITGKPDASDAVINGNEHIFIRAKVRFTHIRFTLQKGMSISVSGTVTLGEGVVVTGGNTDGLVSVRGGTYGSAYSSGALLMTGNAQITGNTNGPGIRGNGADITMTGNAQITGNKTGIRRFDGTLTVTMSDNAKISGNEGVGVEAAKTITLSGNAEISGNKGVGVVLYQEAFYPGTMTLSENAKIVNNRGGGVYAGSGGLTISENASITGNTAKKGGGVYGGQVIMEGGTISGNKAEYGAGVYVPPRASFTLKEGTITDNEAEFVGGGVYAEKGGTYNAQGGTVTGNKAGDGGENVFRQQ